MIEFSVCMVSSMFLTLLHVYFLTGWMEVKKVGGRQMACVQEETSEKWAENAKTITESQENNEDSFFKKSLSKISDLLQAANVAKESNMRSHKIPHNEVSNTQPYYSYCSQLTNKVLFIFRAAQLRNNSMTCGSQSTLPHSQSSKVLTAKSSEWFSLLLKNRESRPGHVSLSTRMRPQSL